MLLVCSRARLSLPLCVCLGLAHLARRLFLRRARPLGCFLVAASMSPPPPPTLSDEERQLVARLPRIDLDGKLFHSHIHKASGTSFLSFVSGMEGVSDCSTSPRCWSE